MNPYFNINRRRIFGVFILLFFLSLPSGINAQLAKTDFQQLSIEHGLSNLSVYCLLQDKEGFIWAGTQAGLNRYDGYTFVSYDRKPGDSSALSDNFINCLLEDRAGRIWAGTRKGLSRFDKATGTFTSFFFDPADPEQLLFNHILALAEDKTGNIWVASPGGLSFLKPGQRQIQKAPLNIAGENDNNLLKINTLLLDKAGLIWMGTTAGLLRFDPESGQCNHFFGVDGKPLPLVQAICEDDRQGLWVGTLAGVYHVNKLTGESKLFKTPGDVLEEVATIIKDSKGQLLVGNARGVDILDPKTGRYTPLFSYINPNDWYRPGRPQALLEDRSKTYWIASLWEGIYHINPLSRRFQHFKRKPAAGNPAPDNYVTGIFEDSRGQAWVGTGTDINLFDPVTGQFSTVFTQPDALFKTAFEDREGTIWIGARFGVIKQAPGKPPVWLRQQPNDPKGSSPGNTKSIFEDSRGIRWFGGANGLFRLEPGSEFFQPFALAGNAVDTNIIYHITEDHRSRLWISTNNGLVRVDSTRKNVRYFQHDPAVPGSLCDNNISCVSATKNGQIWIASYDGGLDRFNPGEETFTHYGREEGLIDEKVWGLVEDDRGFLWLSTSKGLSRFDPATETFHDFDVNDGLQSYEFSLAAFDKGQKTGKLYFGGINGFNYFDPDSVDLNQAPPPVVFTSFRYHEGGLEETSFKSIPGICVLDEVILPHQAKAIVCEFAALDYRQSSKNRYAYRLEGGSSQNWIDLGSKREVTFANLQPGTYTLHVKASNNDGIWNEEGVRLRIVIRPPWWATWWAYLLYAGSLGAAVWFIYRYQLRRRLEQQETHRLRELDDFKNRFFTNITHEFRTPLTVILGTSRQAEAMAGKELEPKISLIRRNGENLLRLINQILDLAKLESNTLKINYVQGDVLTYLRYISESLHSFANAQNVMLRVESKEREIVMDYDPERLLQIVYNLLSNAIKFTPSGGRVTLHAGMRNEEQGMKSGTASSIIPHPSSLFLTVTDTGAGIPAEDLPYIFDRFRQASNLEKARTGGTGIGLALTRELVQALHGEISVKSEVGKGTTFTVKLPITNDAATAPDIHATAEMANIPALPANNGTSSLPRHHADVNILLIEDNPDVVEYLTACLQDHYALDFAYNGRAGIEKALETVPDLIVSDVMMPEKDGFEVCDFLKNNERTSHIPIVLLTAKADAASRIAGLKRGADAYLSKPFNQEELLVVLENLLELRRKLQARYAKMEIGNPDARETTAAPHSSLPDASGQAIPDPSPLIPAPSSLEDAFLQKVQAAVLEHLSDSKFSVDDLCRELAMSQSQLHRKLTALTGKNATLFTRSIRLAQAKSLLQGKTMNVSEAAYQVGFDDPKYFSRVFKEEFGVRPSEV